jgi:hypothetical protein
MATSMAPIASIVNNIIYEIVYIRHSTKGRLLGHCGG